MSSKSPKGTAVITGASAGIGKIYADRLARRGYDLLLVARRGDRLETLAQSLRTDHGISVSTLKADLAAPDDLREVADRISQDDTITMLVNNAGTSTLGQLAAAETKASAAMTDVNVTALVQLTLALLPKLKSRGQGTIINIGSVLGFHSLPISSLYSGTKGYVLNFTRGLQDEVAGTGVFVQLVLPAATATDIWELSGVPLTQLDQASIMTPENLVDAALAGLDQGETITLPSVEDIQLFTDYDVARLKLLTASQTGKPASRYRVN